jgi:guanylate kinase
MGKIFCLMGKSATGKDTIYQELFARGTLPVRKIIPYTTRPIREGETEGNEYYFCAEDKVEELEAAGKIIELRAYDTVYGVWKYFTVDDGQIDLAHNNYLLIGTLETYRKIRDYFGKEKVCPIYIEVEDGERLMRAIAREQSQNTPKYEEMCRRFLADASDFSEEKLESAGIRRRFINRDLHTTIDEVASYIVQEIGR